MEPCNSRREKLGHCGRRSGPAGELRRPQRLERQAQRALVLVERGRLVLGIRFGTHDDPRDPAPTVRVVAPRFVERDDQRPSRWNVALASSGPMLFCNQVSAVAREQSCASLHRFGTMFA